VRFAPAYLRTLLRCRRIKRGADSAAARWPNRQGN